MTDSEIIEQYLKYSFPSSHNLVMQYFNTKIRDKDIIVNEMLKECYEVLIPPYSSGHVRTVIRKFLKNLKF